MPSKLRPLKQIHLSLPHKFFVCPRCRHNKLFPFRNGSAPQIEFYPLVGRRTAQTRAASTTSSVTAVNVKREIPHHLRDLHASLKALEHDAGVYINTSQLQLALRGVESDNAITRIAGE